MRMKRSMLEFIFKKHLFSFSQSKGIIPVEWGIYIPDGSLISYYLRIILCTFTTGFLTCLHSLLRQGKQTLSLLAEGRSPYVETPQGMHQSIIAPSCHNTLCWWAITHPQQKESKLWKLNKCLISEVHPAVCPVNLLENTSNLNIIGLDKLAIISMYIHMCGSDHLPQEIGRNVLSWWPNICDLKKTHVHG